jgi:hypothetical protein
MTKLGGIPSFLASHRQSHGIVVGCCPNVFLALDVTSLTNKGVVLEKAGRVV